MSLEKAIELMQGKEILTIELLKPLWQQKNIESGINSTGHCYAASEALYHLFGGKDVFTPQMAKDEQGNSHWWLLRKSDGLIIDPTCSQFTKLGLTPPYENGKGKGFMQQSLRSKIIMKRLKSMLTLE